MKNLLVKVGVPALLAACALAAPAFAGPVKISQVYGAAAGGATLDANGDFVEIFNSSALPVDISNYSIQIRGGGTATIWNMATVPAGTILPPGRHYLVRFENLTGGIAYTADVNATGGSAMVSTGGVAAIMANQILLTSCPSADPDMVDLFGYGAATNCSLGTPAPQGGHTFGGNNAFFRNNNGCDNTSDNSVDFGTATCDPRNSGGLAGNASASVASVQPGDSITFNATITGLTEVFCVGSPTPSTGQAVNADLTELGGAASVPMVAGGGGAYSLLYTVPVSTPGGIKNVNIVGSDAQGRQFRGVIKVTVAAPPTPTENLGTLTGGLVSRTIPLTGSDIKWYKFTVSADVSVANGTYLDIDTENSARTDGTVYDTYITLFDNGGAIRSQDDDDGSGFHSQLSYGVTTPARPAQATNGGAAGVAYNGRDGTLVAGTYWLAAYGYPNAGGSPATGWLVASTSAQDGTLVVNLNLGGVTPPAPPASFENLGTLVSDGNFITRTTTVTTAGQVKWYKFTLATGIDRAVRTYLDIDTETSTVAATGIGLFVVSDGTLVVSDLTDGTDTLSQISIGQGGRNAPGNGLAYNGRDGATLAAGDYYVAVSSAPVIFGTGWYAISTATNTSGNLVVNIRTGTQGPAAAPTPNTDLGTLAGNRVVDTEGGNPITVTAGQIKWFKMVLPSDANTTTGKYVDFDTYGSSFDTELGLYDSAGNLKASNDDGAAGLISLLTFGDTANIRPAPAGGPDDFARDGRNGDLAAGTVYLAAGIFNVTYNATDFDVSSTATGTGTLVVNIYTNYPTGPTACNAADVAGLGGSIGPDGQLTADDVIVYLDAFFANNLAVADIAVLGGAPGHDGQLTADDIIYFLDRFFAPCS